MYGDDEMGALDVIRRQLGEPYYETDEVLVYCDNSLELMSKIRDRAVNLIVTSPPYNIGKEYEAVKPVDEYIRWTEEWIKKAYEITQPNGALLLNLGYLKHPTKGNAIPIPYLMWDKTDFFLMQEIIWNYGAGVSCKKQLSPRNEKILWYVKDETNYTFNLDEIRDPDVKYPNQKKNGKLRCNPLGKNPSDVWQIPKVTSGTGRASKERTSHPAQFPIELVERIILGFSNPGDIILDPFLGSGTVAEVAIKHGRYVIGIELNDKYCDIASNRLKYLYGQKHTEPSIYSSPPTGVDETAVHFEPSVQSNRCGPTTRT
jgi:DNA modification methylase